MRKAVVFAVVSAAVLAALAACVSTPKPRGPVDEFTFVAGTNKSLTQNAAGTINPATDPQEIRVTVPPGTDLHALVATLSLNKEAVITVISSGTRVVQQNGVTPNDFSVPVVYSVEVPGDKKPWGYRVFVREAETNAQLGILAVPRGATMEPQFSPAVHAYRVVVPYAASSVQLRAGGQSRTLKSITIDGMVLPGVTGTATVPFQGVQERTITIDSVAEDGVTRAQYTVTIQRAPPDTNSSLASLDLGGVPLAPEFSPQQLQYQAVVLFAAQQLVIRARAQSPVAAVTLFPVPPAGGSAGVPAAVHGDPAGRDGAVVDLPPDQSFSLAVQVTAEDGSVQQYLLDIQRAPPDHNADLASLSVSAGTLAPVFTPRIQQYVLALPASAENVQLTAVPSSPVATVSLAGQPGTPVGGKAITVSVEPGTSLTVAFAVRAEDGFQRQYRVLVSRPQDANALLQSLGLAGAQIAPAFSPSVILYDVTVDAGARSFTIQPAAQSRYASVAVDGRPAPAPVVLTLPPGGRRVIVVDVTAQNGTVVRYTLRVSHAAAEPAPPPAPNPPPSQGQSSTPAQGPALTMPPDSGSAHVVVTGRGVKLAARELAAMAAASDQPGATAAITVRPYGAGTIITQYPARVQSSSGREVVITLDARSNGISLPGDGLVEVQTVIPTKAGKALYYAEAQPVSSEIHVEVPFFLYGEAARVAWPAPGTLVQVGGVVSNLSPGKGREADKEDFPKNARGAVTITVQLSDAATNQFYGSQTVEDVFGPQRGRVMTFASPISVPQGASVTYVLSATARNGKAWTASGTAQVWTTAMAYPSGFQPAYIAVTDDLSPSGGRGK